MRHYRMRSRVVKNAPHRTFYVQRRYRRADGREGWWTVARSSSRANAVAFTALSELGLTDDEAQPSADSAEIQSAERT